MKTIEVKVYSYNELTGKAKERAKEWATDLGRFDYVFSDAANSVKQFENIFPIKIKYLDFLETYRNDISICLNENEMNLKGLRLRTYLVNNFGHIFYKPKYIGHIKNRIEHKRIKPTKNFFPYYSAISKEYSCNLTGTCYDMDLLDPFVKFINKPNGSDFEDLLNESISNICKSVQNEIEANCKESAIVEYCENNEYYFTENGKFFK